MKNSYRFFSNRECKYFPCHTKPAPADFNCLFCYCPLYSLGDRCGGEFIYHGADGVKNCMGCPLPHIPAYYGAIIDKLKGAAEKKPE
jgi:Zn-finger protein